MSCRLIVAPPVQRSASGLLVAALMLLACAVEAGAARPGKPARPAAALGAHAMLYLDAPLGFKAVMASEAAALGASLLRVDVPLALIHPDEGPPDYAALDDTLRVARHARIGLVGILASTPWWAADCPPGLSLATTPACPYADLSIFAEHVRGVVARSRGVVRAWEVLNEPDGPWFRGTPEQYAALLDTAITAIRAADPGAKVVMGGTPYNAAAQAFLTRVMQVPGLDFARRVDAANLHVRGPLTTLPGQMRSWVSFLGGLGMTKPLWVTEFGYPSDPVAQLDPNFGQAIDLPSLGTGEAGQAAYLRRAIPALLRGGASKVFVTLRDGQPGPFLTEGLLAGTGVADPPGTTPGAVRKPGFAAVQQLVHAGVLAPRRIQAARRRAAARLAARTLLARPAAK